jgi:hypothetical protein
MDVQITKIVPSNSTAQANHDPKCNINHLLISVPDVAQSTEVIRITTPQTKSTEAVRTTTPQETKTPRKLPLKKRLIFTPKSTKKEHSVPRMSTGFRTLEFLKDKTKKRLRVFC